MLKLLFKPNLDGLLGVHFEVGEGGIELPHPLKFIRIMLEAWNVVHEYKHLCYFKEI